MIQACFRPGRRRWWLVGAGLLLAVLAASRWLPSRAPQAARPAAESKRTAEPARIEAVSALGRLEPEGDIRLLAAPITGIGGSPRITELLVEEGERVRQGQLLARFDNGPNQRAQRQLLVSRIANLEQRLTLQRRDLARYRQLSRAGAISSTDLDSREQQALALEGELIEARAELAKVETDLVNTELRAPIDGTVLRLLVRSGERPGDSGILELGASDRMEAVVEVYESDIGRVRAGQPVSLISENGGFQGELQGRVIRISPQVRQRSVLSTDPTGDADARIVEVRVALDPADGRRVRALTGLKVIARLRADSFRPNL
ncbi:MAG: efflux RND transporter periplasmic adaptor subunit [Prochlorococcaceae cyanobacterium]